jgi:hypothetical protein
MPFPRQDTAVFKVLAGLTKHGDMTIDEIIVNVGYVTEKASRYAIVQLLGRMLNMNYVDCKDGKYIIFPDLKSYVEDIIEASTSKEAKDLVAPAYRNIFTPELKNYNLFANKRGYQ